VIHIRTASLASRQLALALEGEAPVMVKLAQGGETVGEVERDRVEAQDYLKKHLSDIRAEELVVQLRPFASAALLDWIAASWSPDPPPKNCTLYILDHNFNIEVERRLRDVRIIESSFAALDAASKEYGTLTLRMTAASSSDEEGTGKLQVLGMAHPKVWLSSHFRLDIGGLDTSRVRRVESLVVRAPERRKDKMDFPHLSVTINDPLDGTWAGWYKDFVLEGNNEEGKEKSGGLQFLAPDLKTALGHLELHNLGLFSLKKQWGASEEMIGRTVAEMYCENMELHGGGAGK
jgi:hypothetical protein